MANSAPLQGLAGQWVGGPGQSSGGFAHSLIVGRKPATTGQGRAGWGGAREGWSQVPAVVSGKGWLHSSQPAALSRAPQTVVPPLCAYWATGQSKYRYC